MNRALDIYQPLRFSARRIEELAEAVQALPRIPTETQLLILTALARLKELEAKQ